MKYIYITDKCILCGSNIYSVSGMEYVGSRTIPYKCCNRDCFWSKHVFKVYISHDKEKTTLVQQRYDVMPKKA